MLVFITNFSNSLCLPVEEGDLCCLSPVFHDTVVMFLSRRRVVVHCDITCRPRHILCVLQHQQSLMLLAISHPHSGYFTSILQKKKFYIYDGGQTRREEENEVTEDDSVIKGCMGTK